MSHFFLYFLLLISLIQIPLFATEPTPPLQAPITNPPKTNTQTSTKKLQQPSELQTEELVEGQTQEIIGQDMPQEISYSSTAASDNAQSMGIIDTQKNIVEAVPLEMPPVDPNDTLISPEESAAALAAGKAEKESILAAEEQKESSKKKEAKEREKLFEYNLTGLKEAGVDISKNGFGITATMAMPFGPAIRTTFAVNTDGLLAQSYIKEFAIGPLFKLTGAGPDGKYGTADDGVIFEVKINNKVQHIRYSGFIDILGRMSETEVLLGSDKLSIFAKSSLFGIFNTLFFGELKFTDTDFMIAATMDSKLISYIEDAATAAVGAAGDAIVSLTKKAQAQFDNARKKLVALQKKVGDIKEDIKKTHQHYLDNFNNAQKKVDNALAGVKEADANLTRDLRKILAARNEVSERKKNLDAASAKVDKLNDDISHAKRKLRKISRSMKWYEFWKVGELAYWSVRIAAIGSALGIATAALEISKSALKVTASLITGVYAIAYAASEASLKLAYATLQAALVAANPVAAEDLIKITAYGIELSTTEIAYYSSQAFLLSCKGVLEATKQMTKGYTIVAKEMVKGILGIFRIDGGGFKCKASQLKKGQLDLYLLAEVFGARKSLKLVFDMTKPDKTLAGIGKMIGDVFNPTITGGPDMIKEIEEQRKKFSGDIAALDAKKETATKEKNTLLQKQKEQEEALRKLKADHEQRLAAMKEKFPLTAEDIKNMGDLSFISGDQTVSIVDEKNPTSYTVGNMKNTFRWLEGWKLPQPQAGTILFDTLDDGEIHIGFHHTITESEQTYNKDFDILLGTQDNTLSLIRSNDNKTLLSSGDPEGMIPPHTSGALQSYWVSINKGYVAAGRGKVPGESILFDYQIDNLPENLSYFSFSSGTNRISITNITTAPPFVNTFGSRYSTVNGYNLFSWPFKLPAINNGTILFKAKARSGLAIGLTDNPATNFPRYLGVIGAEENTKLTMATNSQNGKTYTYRAISENPDGLLPEKETYKDYWATFNNGHFALGMGKDATKNILIDMNIDPMTLGPSILEAQSAAPPTESSPQAENQTPQTQNANAPCPIHYFSFSSWNDPVEIRDITVQQAVPVPFGSLFSAVNKKYACTWRDEWKLPATGKGIIQWQGKGSSDMCVALHTDGSADASTYTYLCIIGADKNSKTVLQDENKKILTQNTDLAALIRTKNSYTDYWLAYNDGEITVGTGNKPGENSTLECNAPAKPITHFSFTNNTGYTEFSAIKTQEITTPITTGMQYTALEKSAPFYHKNWKILPNDMVLFICMAKAKSGFTICFKDETNKEYPIVFGPDGDEKITITDPFNFYPYWVSYSRINGGLSYGRGIVAGVEKIGTKILEDKPTLMQYGFSNSTKDAAYFKNINLYNAQESSIFSTYKSAVKQTSFISSPQQADYSWLTGWKFIEQDSAALTFSTRSSATATIAFANATKNPLYEVAINKTEVVIKNKGTIVARTTDSDACLTEEQVLSDYWINYYKGHIVIGTGKTLKNNIVLEWFDEKAEKNITLSSFAGASTVFENIFIQKGSPFPLYQVYSAAHEQGVFNWLSPWLFAKPEKSCISFDVKTGADALIGLGTGANALYTISIGEKSFITRGGNIVATNNDYDADLKLEGDEILDPEYKSYWIIFNKGYVALGAGRKPSTNSLIVEYQGLISADIVQRFSLSSTTQQATYKNITVSAITGMEIKQNTNYTALAQKKNYTFGAGNRWKLFEQNKASILFDAKGEAPFSLGFDNNIGTRTAPEYEVVIGAEKNTVSQIRKKGDIVASTSSPYAVINTPKKAVSYWATVNQGRISAGLGNTPGKQAFLDWIDPSPIDINYFSFSSDTNTAHYTKIDCLAAVKQEKLTDYILPASLGKYKFDPDWKLPEANFGGVQVKAQGKNDICIGLHNGTSGTPRYEVIIGAEKNTSTLIKANGTVVASIDNPDALIKNEYVPTTYWVLYDHGIICVGSDEIPGKNMTLYWKDPQIQDATTHITYYGFSSNDAMITLKNIKAIPGVNWSETPAYSSYNKQGIFTWNPEWKIKADQTITFDITAPKGEVYIGFNTLTNGSAKYAIVLGGWQNTLSAIMQNDIIETKYETTVKPTTQQWWITYRADSISVGTGDPHSKELFSWQNKSPSQNIAYFSLSSGTTGVLYENIKVIPAGPITKPLTTKDTKAIEIARPDTLQIITDPNDPRSITPGLAAILTEPEQSQTSKTPLPQQPAKDSTSAAPIDSKEFLTNLNPTEFTEVNTEETTTPTPLTEDQLLNSLLPPESAQTGEITTAALTP